MSEWSEGYVSDIEYTFGFYRRMAPSHLRFLAAVTGYQLADEKGLNVAELGCGQGLGTLLLAASNPDGRFFGFDFNPVQIARARGIAAEAAIDNVTFRENSFAELAAAPAGDMPDFDLVVCHGVYSWITPENRAAIVTFLRRKLKPGGFL
jgi:SAM-dependent methyltransferase